MRDDEMRSELEQPGAQELLRSAPLLHLAYRGLDGTPRVIPIGFLWNGTAIVICTIVDAPKNAALRRRPSVAVTIDSGHSPADSKSLLVRGPASLETLDGIPREYIDAAAKTMSPDEVAGFEQAVTAGYEQMVRITITPTWARFYDFGAGRLPATLQRTLEAAAQRG
ncbi:pyridoxamine 5'-phosphate oxidase family protein [Schumannella sp. 10F1B-5-1]|uniref:pyridoxamine 5'-phosphate oxidase family protein n=1 Tax=Schumannella sp. 10F1B-5-1 TaxID=2590780 RepID=UPI00113135C0|nr:pyridoxamine 5'-phosphate oxidase family protein [Schumannella sp. 10F1B-5-1]TPW70127.1 pyridoxamine 5-phosphate oxidase [Schumannella sp. 10F1B-5-1]